MRLSLTSFIPAMAGLAAATVGFFSTAGAQDAAAPAPGSRAVAVFAGGCFWCVEADFDKVDGVLDTESGYTGGSVANPTYRQVSYSDTGHVEAVRVTYDPTVVSYEQLVDYYFRHIDPTDADGQFCDKGPSYRPVIFVANADQRTIAENEKSEIEASGVLPGPVVAKVRTLGAFWPAEEYHQDYYLKQPAKYELYRNACGRDRTLKKVWSGTVTG